ncbi:heme lyase NrfEFG subunit NrfF [Vibrio ponticus]|uniref:Formate-dependent nitrite reductase complex subunit n=1 Tax=Vibrio ponticus TaxID=265668 RepID=A0A3N3E4G4_9VIBR|nr:heme lyase NrfEFG subunit NrfF [Vibrio ponticus]ROV58779.1 heme lyase NrfEFG subunit NrfF [Vibrio ponticus]ROV61624.1 heme lyase NrfEFG subunit NrfF [Vibrio ponticus]
MRWILLSLSLCTLLAFADTEQLFVASDEQQITRVELFEFASPKLQQQAINLAKSLRCPQCQNQNLVESNSPIALDLRLVVFEMINQGKSEQQVIDYMTARYGDFVLYNPPFSLQNSVLWGLPVLVLLLFGLCSVMGVVGRKNNA